VAGIHTGSHSISLNLRGKADADQLAEMQRQCSEYPTILEVSMETVLFNFIILFFAASGFMAWAFIIFICILYFFINRDLDFFDADRERLG
jgi:hypothetical protein